MSFFPRTAWPLSRLRPPIEQDEDATPDVEPAAPSRLRRVRVVASRIATLLAFVLLWTVLVSPNEPRYVTAGTFLRIPLELLVIVAVGLVLPPPWRRIVAGVAGAVFAVLAIVKLLNLGFFYELDRPFNPIGDWASFGPAAGVLRDSAGELWTVLAVVGAILLVLFLLVFVTISAIHVTTLTARHRTTSARTVGGLAIVWALCAALGVQAVGGASVASATTARLADSEVHLVSADISDQHTFAADLKSPDPFAITPGKDLLTGLRGKDVLIVFVESYGQVSVQNTFFSPPIDAHTQIRYSRVASCRILLKKRLYDVADVRGHQLAGARDVADGALGEQCAALRPAHRQPPLHTDRRIQQSRLANCRGRALE